MNIADSTVADFQKEGVVVLRGVFRDWVEPLSRGVPEVMAHPSPLERSYQPKDGSAAVLPGPLQLAAHPCISRIYL